MTTEQIRRAVVNAAASEGDAARRESGIVAAGATGAAVDSAPAETIGLEVRGLSVRFGGVSAVQGVSLAAPMGSITGLVGPNGAGKTTTFNACSGLVRPSDGAIVLHGRDVSSLGPSGRSRLGLGRSFQRVELFSSLTVRENVALGREASLAGANPARQLVSSSGQRATVRRAVEDAIELTGIGPLADLQAGLLPTGQRRMVELARVLAGPFDLLLLDEPSSGLDAGETRRFGEILTGAIAERGVGILLVEHDMALVRQVCQKIYVLDFGQMIFEGSAAAMLASPTVRNAYLGSESGMALGSDSGMAGAVVAGAPPPGAPSPRAVPPCEQTMLELEGITAGYGETVVLRDVSLSVPDSGVVALLGPNGAGKTTTLRAASGLIRPISGRVLLDGEDVTGLKPYAMARRGLCHLPEGHGIFPSLTVKENIVLSSPKGRERESLVRAGDQFPVLAARLGQQAGSLSGGEQQMLSLVRASLTNPRIVVVDEASLGLSPLLVDRVFDALRQIVAGGTALLLVEQYVTRALDLADTAYIMNRGQVVHSGAASDLQGEEVFERYLGIEVGP